MANNLYKIYVTSNGEWETIELDELNIDTVFSVEEITDISQRKDNITKSITLKGTKQNNKVLGALYSLDREVDSNPDTTNLMFNYKPNKYLDCFVLENNIEIIRGKLLITSVDIRKGVIYYNCNIVGNVFSFFSNLNDKNLEHLDSLDVDENRNIRFNSATIPVSWDANNFNAAYDDSNTQYPNLIKDSKMERYVNYGTGGTLSEYDSDSTKVYRVDMNATAGAVMGIQTGQPNRNLSVVQGQTYTFSFKMRGNITTLNYAYLMRNSGSNMSVLITSLPNIDETIWNTYRVTFNSPFTASDAWVMMSYRNVSGVGGRFFEVKDVKLSSGAMTDTFTYNPDEFKYLDYVFPMINYGGRLLESGEDVSWDASKRRVRWTDYKPAIYVRSYIDAMFNGWRYDEATDSYTQLSPSKEPLRQFRWSSSLKNDYAFNRLIIPYNEEYWRSNIKNDVDFSDKPNVFEGGWFPLDHYGDTDSEGWKPIYVDPAGIPIPDPQWVPDVLELVTITAHGKTYNDVIDIKETFNGTITVTGRVMFERVNPQFGSLPRAGVAIIRVDESDKVGSSYSFDASNFKEHIIVQRNSRSNGPSDGSGENGTFTLTYTGLLSGKYIIAIQRSHNGYSDFYFSPDTSINITGEPDGIFEMNWGEDFNLYNTIPKGYSCREFLKSVMLLNNLFMISDKEDDRLFHIYTYDEFNQKMLNRVNTGEAEDWSDKIDWESYSLSSNLKLAKGYDFTYKEAEDYWNEYYTENTGRIFGDYKIIDSAGLIESHTTEVMFNPTMNLNWKFNSQIPQVYKADTFLGGEPPESYKGDLRILYFIGGIPLEDGLPYDLVDQNGEKVTNGTVPLTNPLNGKYGYASMNLSELIYISGGNFRKGGLMTSLMFGIPANVSATIERDGVIQEFGAENILDMSYSLYNNFHRNRIRELTDPNLITMEAEAYLNEGDIARLDFRAPIYIQSPFGSAYFKLLRVEYSDSNSTSRVTLQKVVLPDSNIR